MAINEIDASVRERRRIRLFGGSGEGDRRGGGALLALIQTEGTGAVHHHEQKSPQNRQVLQEAEELLLLAETGVENQLVIFCSMSNYYSAAAPRSFPRTS